MIRRPAALALATLVMGLAACVTEGPPLREPPRPIPSQPSSLQATAMSFSVATYVSDDDGNGFVDAFDATVYLFNEQYAFPLNIPGSLTFTLQDRGGQALFRWSFDPAQTADLMRDLPPGPGYIVRLSLLAVSGGVGGGGDRLESGIAELTCEFLPSNGPAVRSKGGRPVRVGRLR